VVDIAEPLVRTYRSAEGEFANNYQSFLRVTPLGTGPKNLRVTLDQIKERSEFPQMQIAQLDGVLHKGDEPRVSLCTGYYIGRRELSANSEHIEKIDTYKDHAMKGLWIECRQPHGMEKPRLAPGKEWNLLVRLSADNCHPVYVHIYIENRADEPLVVVRDQGTKRIDL
jgi:hypothetical protein